MSFHNHVMMRTKLFHYNRAINITIMRAKNNTFCKIENSMVSIHFNPYSLFAGRMLPVLAQIFFKIAGKIFPIVSSVKYFNVCSSNSKLL